MWGNMEACYGYKPLTPSYNMQPWTRNCRYENLAVNTCGSSAFAGASYFSEFTTPEDFSNFLLPNFGETSLGFEQSFYQDPPQKSSEIFEVKKADKMSAAAMTTQSELTPLISAVTQSINNPYMSKPLNMTGEAQKERLESVTENKTVTLQDNGSHKMSSDCAKTPEDCNLQPPDVDFEVEQARFQRAAWDLNISKNPLRWNKSEVNKWVNWVFTNKYETQPRFWLDLEGHSLCMCTTSDFESLVNDQEKAADILYVEIDLWKRMYSMELEKLASQQPQQYLQQQHQQQHHGYSCDHPVYADLDNSNTIPSPVQRQSRCSITVIPTPVMTHQMNPVSIPLDQRHYQYNPNPAQQMSPVSSVKCVCDSPRSSPSGSSTATGGYTSVDEDRELSPAPTMQASCRGPMPHSRNSIKLWQFLKNLLDQPNLTCIQWQDREKGIFKIQDSQTVARLWGQRKNRPLMNYDKLSRSIRQYYKKKIIRKTDNSKRLVYQFYPAYLRC